MSYDTLLTRLRSPWSVPLRAGLARSHRAYCPCCQPDGGSNPALSVAETDVGAVLIWCFKGCSALDVIAAAGMQPEDLFPVHRSSYSMSPTARKDGPSAWVSAEALADAAVDAVASSRAKPKRLALAPAVFSGLLKRYAESASGLPELSIGRKTKRPGSRSRKNQAAVEA